MGRRDKRRVSLSQSTGHSPVLLSSGKFVRVHSRHGNKWTKLTSTNELVRSLSTYYLMPDRLKSNVHVHYCGRICTWAVDTTGQYTPESSICWSRLVIQPRVHDCRKHDDGTGEWPVDRLRLTCCLSRRFLVPPDNTRSVRVRTTGHCQFSSLASFSFSYSW